MIQFADIATITYGIDPANALVINATLGVLDTETGQPPIEPTTGQPIPSVAFRDAKLNEATLKRLMAEWISNFETRKSQIAVRDAAIAELQAIKSKGGTLTPDDLTKSKLQAVLETAVGKVIDLKKKIEAGVLTPSDQAYIDAIAAADAAALAFKSAGGVIGAESNSVK